MLPTFVNKRVTGAERGDYYALDLGGTNFRVLRLTLEGGGVVGPVKSMKFAIPDAAKTGTGAELFGFLADSVARFIALECGGDVNPNPNPPNPDPNPDPSPDPNPNPDTDPHPHPHPNPKGAAATRRVCSASHSPSPSSRARSTQAS